MPLRQTITISVLVSRLAPETHTWIKGTPFSAKKKTVRHTQHAGKGLEDSFSYLISSSLDILHLVFNSNSSLLGVSNTAPQPTSPRVSRHQRYPTCQEGCFSEAPPLIARIMSNGFKTPMGVLTVEPRFETGMNGKGSTLGSTGLRTRFNHLQNKNRSDGNHVENGCMERDVCVSACVD